MRFARRLSNAFALLEQVFFRDAAATDAPRYGYGYEPEPESDEVEVEVENISKDFDFAVGEHTGVWEVGARMLDSSVELRAGGSLVLKLWESGERQAVLPPARTTLDVRLQGVHTCFINNQVSSHAVSSLHRNLSLRNLPVAWCQYVSPQYTSPYEFS